jgi:YesN/AraC family two-component response regulator
MQAVRVEAAKATPKSGSVAIQNTRPVVSYDDGAFFRSPFKRSAGMTPAEYRDRFATMGVRSLASQPLA